MARFTIIRKRPRPRRMTSLQKTGAEKHARKAHTSVANINCKITRIAKKTRFVGDTGRLQRWPLPEK
uniref:Uncharacterized protein n=1 Tax=Salmonella sp. TaxID=599 RepID=A0A482ETD6_SALSP|nr:hypothetical protein NNIBIDOC_00149 [Salmonella sp.]